MSHIQLISLLHYERKRLLKSFNDKTTLTNTATVLNYENLQILVLSSFLENVATFVKSLVVKSEQHFLYLSFYSLKSYTHQCYYCNTFQCVVQSENAFVAVLLKSLNTFCSVRIYSITTVIYRKDRHCHY